MRVLFAHLDPVAKSQRIVVEEAAMFGKTFLRLLLLTTVLCSGDITDYDRGVFQLRPDDVQLGRTVTVTGTKQAGEHFVIDLLYADYKTIPLHLYYFDTDTKIVLSSFTTEWGQNQILWGTLVNDVKFPTEYTFEADVISIKMNGSRLMDFPHRMPFEKITAIGIKGRLTPGCIFGYTQGCASTL